MDKSSGGRAKKSRRDMEALPYQEPHQTAPGLHKLLEESIGREVKRFREKLTLTISEVAKAAETLGLTVHDHIVIGRAGHTSFKGLGLL